MPTRVLLSAILVFSGGLLWAARVLFGASPWSPPAGSLLAIGLVAVTAVKVVAMVLSPGRWVRNSLGLLGSVWAVVAIVTRIDLLWAAAVVTGGAGLGLTWTRPLDAWLHPVKPDRVPTRATVLTLGVLWIPAIVGGLALPDVTVGGWILAGFGLVAGWAYARALPVGLWGLRLATLPLCTFAMIGLRPWAASVLVADAAMLTYLAWTADARLAIERPSPRRVDSRSILPEVTPPGLLESAGYDRRGHPLGGSG